MQSNSIGNCPIIQENTSTQNGPRDITIADFERVCRTCLCIVEEIRPIFEITHDTISMHTILDTLIALRVRKKDDLPKHLCLNCIAEMCRFYTFRDKCRNVQNVLEAIQFQALKREADHDQGIIKEEILQESQRLWQEDDAPASINNELDFGTASDEDVENNAISFVKPELSREDVKPEGDDSEDDDIPLGDRFKLIIKKTAHQTGFETKEERLKRERQERKERREKKEQKIKREEDKEEITIDRPQKRRKTRENNKRKLIFKDLTKIKHRKQRKKAPGKLKQRIPKHRRNGKLPPAYLSSQEGTPPSSPNSDPNTPKSYKCRDCPESFSSRHFLNDHRREARHPEVRTHECHICRKMFTSSKLRQHMRSHTKEKPFLCKHCGKGFTMSGNLKRHTMSHTGERPHVCEICGKGFIQHTTLIAHRRVHAKTYDSLPGGDEPLFNCEQCGRGFKRSWRFNQHLARHHTQQTHPNQISLPPVFKRTPVSFPTCADRTIEVGGGEIGEDVGIVAADTEMVMVGIKSSNSNPASPSVAVDSGPIIQQKHACPICFRSYKSKLYLKSHMATHGEKKFLCSDCGKGFVTKAALQSHLKVHTGEKPHKCTLCHKSFAHVGSFESHMLIHTGQKPYSCNICGKNFTQLSHLKYHLRIHSGEKPYACSYCGKCFALKGNLTVHVRTHTGETPYVCPDCGKGFYDSSSMKKHRRGHGEMQGKGTAISIYFYLTIIFSIKTKHVRTSCIIF